MTRTHSLLLLIVVFWPGDILLSAPADKTLNLSIYSTTAPAGYRSQLFNVAGNNGKVLGITGGNWALISSGADWGNIGGTLTDQTDLTAALALKAPLANATFTGTTAAAAFSGPLTGNVTGNLTGNVTGNLTGNVTGNVTGTSGSTTGNAATATALETARTINGTSFNGTANITVPAAAETLPGTALPALSGAALTALSAANINTGTLAVANGGTGITSLGTGVATWLGTPSSANLAAAATDETGSGALVFATSPTLVTPILGTPTSGALTNCTSIPSGQLTGDIAAARITTALTTAQPMAATTFTASGLSSLVRTNIAAGTLTDTVPGLSFSATMPTTITATNNAVNWQITSAGSSSFGNRGINVDYLAGYTGAAATAVGRFANAAAGTLGSMAGGLGNLGCLGIATATTAGYNQGTVGAAFGGDANAGLLGISTTAKNSAKNIGVAGFALNTGTSPIHIGVFGGLMNADPTFASAAGLFDNGSTTSNIFVARDNGGAVFTIADGGNVTATGNLAAVAVTNSLSSRNVELTGNGLAIGNTQVMSWAPSTAYGNAGDLSNVKDLTLSRNSAGVLAVGTTGSNALGSIIAAAGTFSGAVTVGAGTAMTKVLSAAASLDYDLTALTLEDKTITVTGAALGDTVSLGVPNGSVTATASFTGWVSSTNTVTIRCKTAAAGENPASGTFRATVTQF